MDIRFVSAIEAAAWVADGALMVDLRPRPDYIAAHPGGAVHLAGTRLSASRAPVGGLLPDTHALDALLGSIGLQPARAVVAFDAEGAASGRLLWTLDVMGHRAPGAILDGGMHAWRVHGGAIRSGSAHREPARYAGVAGDAALADAEWILARLGDPGVVFLDVRTPEEFRGEDVRAARGGHIPGAVNLDWRRVMTRSEGRQLRSRDELMAEFTALGVTPEKEVVCYCQTHQRSSHTYAVLKWLGFERVRGYHGAWSEWGNDAQLPLGLMQGPDQAGGMADA